MIRILSSSIVRLATKPSFPFTTTSEGAEFLSMVEKYFDNAGKHTDIRPDQLNFYKKADNVVKFNLTLIRGISNLIQMMEPLKSSLPIDASIKLTNSQPKEELDMQKMLISLKSKLWLA